ncbi:membrane-bound lytic murein transglycosylase MltF [Pseudidiomarina aestuarii]|uniref:Membrane-bound lytic murein transglycosylase F n=2 Tax=Pseudidiomarina aestuarii TaxID=624146 RepID=A0A7Z6ZSB4_9GAMM|nr:membrane-bound lytic murein transglycosylase MltF [Pseudidiomarina aestuarii]RUO39187.1 membrane-bound lytic murein transglycosylase MltF [Pseudidiomarina aestuarii]
MGIAMLARWLSLIISVMVLLGCAPQAQDSQLQLIQERGVLRVGTLLGPSTYFLDQERDAGLEYVLARAFADDLGVELEMVPRYSVTALFNLLQNNEVDILAAGLDRTAQREQSMRFGPPYQVVEQKVVFKQGSRTRPRSLEDIEAELVVMQGSSHDEYLQQVTDDFPELPWRTTDEHDANELLEQVVRGDLAYTIADTNTLDIKRRYYPDLSVAFTVRENVDIAWALKKDLDASLYAEVIGFFGQLRNSGQLAQLIDQHFGHVASFNYVDTSLFIQAVENKLPRYRELFEKHAGTLDWRLLAAISYQESLWNPRAVSPTGVRGLMMLTLPTAQQMGVQSRLNPEESIRGGARYVEQMIDRIPARIRHPDRLWFALAAYNIGLGHLEDARVLTQQQGADPDRWIDVRKRLPLLRQKRFYRQTRYGFARGDEPVRYVGNIRRYYDTLVWLDERGRIPSSPLIIALPENSADEVN